MRPALVALLAVLAGLGALGVPGASAQSSGDLPDGSIVLSRQVEGDVLARLPDGTGQPVITGLAGPRGVAVMPDGTVVVAESGANRVVGIGGRYGDELTTVATIPFPNSLAAGADGTLFVTSFSEGRLVAVDLDTGAVVDRATGLDAPSGVAVRNDTAYVVELNAQRVVAVDPAGQVTPVVEALPAPVGVAVGRGTTLYVTDAERGEVLQVEAGEATPLATLPSPQTLATDPANPLGDDPFRLLVATADGVVELDPATGEGPVAAPVPGAVGVAVVGAVAAPPTTAPPTTAAEPDEGVVTTTAAPTTTEAGDVLAATAEPEDDVSGSPVPVVLGALAILAVVGGFLLLQLRRATAPDDDEDEEPRDETPLHEAFGPCVTEELEVERAQAALNSNMAQLEALQRRIEDGTERIDAAEQRRAEAAAARLAEQERVAGAVAAGELDDPGPHPIHLAEARLRTDEGRAALAAYRDGELSPLGLAQRWKELEEAGAIERVRQAGARALEADLTVPGPLEREAAAEVAEIREDVAQAKVDLGRLVERTAVLRGELSAAQTALAACRDALGGGPVDDGHHHDPEQEAAWAAGAAAPGDEGGDGPEVVVPEAPDEAEVTAEPVPVGATAALEPMEVEPEPAAEVDDEPEPAAEVDDEPEPEPEPVAEVDVEVEPGDDVEGESEPVAEVDVEPEPAAEPEPEPEPEPAAEVDVEVEPGDDVEVESEPVAEVDDEPEPAAEPEPEPEPAAEVDDEPEPGDDVEVESEPVAEVDDEPEPEPAAEVDDEPEPEPEPEPAAEPEPEPEPEPAAEVDDEPEPVAEVDDEPEPGDDVEWEYVEVEVEVDEDGNEVEPVAEADQGEDLDPVARLFTDLASSADERIAAPAPPAPDPVAEPADGPDEADLAPTVAAMFGDAPVDPAWERRQALDLRDVPESDGDPTPAVLGWFRRRKERTDDDRPVGPPSGGPTR